MAWPRGAAWGLLQLLRVALMLALSPAFAAEESVHTEQVARLIRIAGFAPNSSSSSDLEWFADDHVLTISARRAAGAAGGEPGPAPEQVGTTVAVAAAALATGRETQPDSGLQQQRRLAGEEEHGGTAAPGDGGPLAFCLFTKDQQDDLLEWLEHHLGMGASRIYLVDDGSEPPLLTLSMPYVRRGQVEYVRLLNGHDAYQLNGLPRPQQWSYNWCNRERGGRHRWMAFVDADEFVMFTDGSHDLPGYLERYRQYGGLSINWWAYGSDNHTTRPRGGAVANYLHCNKERSVKTIANTEWLLAFNGSVHNPEHYKAGKYSVNEQGHRVEGPFSTPHPQQYAFVAHYVTKSKEEFQAKLARGGGVKRDARTPEFFDIMNRNTWNKPPCNESLQYVHPLLRRSMHRRR